MLIRFEWLRRLLARQRPTDTPAPAAPARRAPYRWRRRDAGKVVTLEDALRHQTPPDVDNVDPRRAASESRARGLEETVEKLRQQMAQLEETLQVVGQRSRHFERSYRQLKTQLETTGGTKPGTEQDADPSGTALYAKVGLSPECPEFIVEAARRAFARRYHPDSNAGRAEPDASAAEFRYYMRIFDVLQERRRRPRP